MKKILLLSVALFSFSFEAMAQQKELLLQTDYAAASVVRHPSLLNAGSKIVSTTINDTLDYFFNKHYYRNLTTPASAPANLQFLTIKSPYQSSSINLGYCGALFLNSSPITVSGLKGLVIKQAGSPSATVSVKLYLCNVNASNLPILPPLDSVTAGVSTTTAGVWAGGSFTAPVNVNGNFAVLFKSGSTVAGDTIRLFLNNAFSATATSVPAVQRYGEGFGLITFNGNVQSTSGAFGGSVGNDYEFVVAPYVSFNVSAGAAAVSPSICNLSNGSFTNISSPMSLIENRQFNFNKFKPYWSPTNTLTPVTDSIYNWTFTGSSTGATTAKNPTAYFNVLGNQSANLTVKYRRSRSPFNPSVNDLTSATINVNNGSAPLITVSGATTFCTNAPITTTLYCTGNPTYTWTAPLNTVSAIVVITQTAASAVYTVLAQNGGCTAIKTVTILVNPIPTVSLTAPQSVLCSVSSGGSTMPLNGSPSGGVFAGVNVSGTNFNPLATGTFSPVYSYTNASTGCTNTATAAVIVQNCSGLSANKLNSHLLLYPNPTSNGILFLRNLEGDNTLEVYNVLGSLILRQRVNKEEFQLDLSNKANGHYFLKITDSYGESQTLKIVNQN